MDALLILTRFLLFVLSIGPERRPPAIGWRSTDALYNIHMCNSSSILHCQSAAAFGSNGALANLSTASAIIPKLPFLPSKCGNYTIFIGSSE